MEIYEKDNNKTGGNGKYVYFRPISSRNKYISIMQKAIKLAGYNLITDKHKTRNFIKSDIFHFNWFLPAKSSFQYLKQKIFFKLIKLTGKKIVITFHNKTAHNPEWRTNYFYDIFKYMLEISDRIIIHCSDSYKFIEDIVPKVDRNKIFYVPHPNYIGAYSDTIKYSRYIKKSGEFVLLFIGSLDAYKNPDVVIKVANSIKNISRIHFLICGDSNQERKNYLTSLIDPDNKNITADFRFIDNNEIPSLMKISDIVLLPYNPVSMLNSGAAHLAFSYGKTVITNDDVGTIKDLPNKNLVYTYKYENDINSHVEVLRKLILNIRDEFLNEHEKFLNRGIELKNIMTENNSIENVSKKILKAYEGL